LTAAYGSGADFGKTVSDSNNPYWLVPLPAKFQVADIERELMRSSIRDSIMSRLKSFVSGLQRKHFVTTPCSVVAGTFVSHFPRRLLRGT
jgi:hypothetical protein